jgi:hypothetical protein
MKKILTLAFLITTLYSFSQGGYNWGTSKKDGEANYYFLTKYYNTEKFQECRPKIQWLIKDAPNLHKDLYIIAASVYKRAEEAETNPDLKLILQDSSLYMYRQQINRFGLKADGYNYMGQVAYTYLSTRTNPWDTLANIYNRVVEYNDTAIFVENIYSYLASNSVMKQLQKLTDVQYLDKYQTTIRLIQHHKKINKGNAAMITYLDNLEQSCNTLFAQYLVVDCKNIATIYDLNNLTLDVAYKAQKIMESNKCTTDPKYLKVIEFLFEKDPTVENTKHLADYYYSNNNKSKAIEMYQNIVTLKASEKIIGESAYKLMGYYSASSKEKTRSYARICIANGYQAKQAHETIGDLYINSLNDCRIKEKEDIVLTRTLYIAAYKEYKLAGEVTKMAVAKKQFPSAEELFLGTYKVGQSLNTGCWINEDVALQTR